MQRKSFLQLASLGLLPLGTLAATENNLNRNRIKIPPYLQKGDTIGICCPSGFSTMVDIQQSIIQMESWGYKIKLGQ